MPKGSDAYFKKRQDKILDAAFSICIKNLCTRLK